LLKAAESLNGEADAAFYENPALYGRYASIFMNFTEIFTRLLHQECAQRELLGTLSPMLDLLVKEVTAS